MAIYHFAPNDVIEIDFKGVKPNTDVRNELKSVHFMWNPDKKVWWAKKNESTIAMANKICEKNYGLKLKIEEIINATQGDQDTQEKNINLWVDELKTFVDRVIGASHTDSRRKVSSEQTNAWEDCFTFIQTNLKDLSTDKQQFELVFEYSMPGTVAERPDVLLLTDKKVISLEFKKKDEPQMDDDRNDIAQALRYKNWLQNHHKVTKDRDMEVESYLVCTTDNAKSKKLTDPEIEILTKDNFYDTMNSILSGEKPCSFVDEWLASTKTEMPDMLQAVYSLWCDDKIPYIADLNKNCLDTVLDYIEEAKSQNRKKLILINGVPGSGKTAIGQSVVFEEDRDGEANAVYLSGNGPLVSVLKYIIEQTAENELKGFDAKQLADNPIQKMASFKYNYFDNDSKNEPALPEQSILVFDEAQRAWNEDKMNDEKNDAYYRYEYSEPEGLFRLGDRIYCDKNYAVLIGLYGNGQTIYNGEETDLSLWKDAIKDHNDWDVIVSQNLADQMQEVQSNITIDNNVFLSESIRSDFIDCSKWADQAINRDGASLQQAKEELEKLREKSMYIYLTRDFNKVLNQTKKIDKYHPEWTYGILISNFAEEKTINKVLPGWKIGYQEANVLFEKKDMPEQYGPWFIDRDFKPGKCKDLQKAATVFDIQGLELDCPIIVFGGEYIRKEGKWQPDGDTYKWKKKSYKDPAKIVENNFRVLLTRARKEMILVIPEVQALDETYQYFEKMGLEIL